jgi:hypothetical protein
MNEAYMALTLLEASLISTIVFRLMSHRLHLEESETGSFGLEIPRLLRTSLAGDKN